jgi:hypothetical protein
LLTSFACAASIAALAELSTLKSKKPVSSRNRTPDAEPLIAFTQVVEQAAVALDVEPAGIGR